MLFCLSIKKVYLSSEKRYLYQIVMGLFFLPAPFYAIFTTTPER